METRYYSPSRRSYYTSYKDASPEEIRSSLRSVKRDYVQALEEIEDLKLEKANLKAVLNQSFQDKAEEDYRKQSVDMENASQRLKQSYTQKALIEAEQRIVELEDENIKLRRLVDSNSTRLKKLQEQLVSTQDQVDKLDHLKVFNKHLQAEMQYLDQEFQSIIKRVEDLDEEKTKQKIKKSVSVKYSQDYNQTILKYVNYIMTNVSNLNPNDPIRSRFEELFPISSNMLKLVANKDFSNLMLKSFKFMVDLLPRDADQEQFSPTFSQATCVLSHSASNGQINLDISRLSSQVTTSSKGNTIQSSSGKKERTMTPTAKNRPNGTGIPPASSEKAKVISRQDSLSNANKKSGSQLSVSFGAKEFKPRLLRSTTPNDLRPVEATSPLRTNQSGVHRNEVVIHDRMVAGPAERSAEKRNGTFSSKVAEYQDQAEQLEMIQRERELIEKERELMEKKRELLNKARELQEKEQALQERDEEELRQQEMTEASIEHSRSTHSYKRSQGNNSYADIRRIRQEEKERTKSPTHNVLKPILKSSSSQLISMDQEASKKSLGSTPANRSGAVKDFSNVLREKSKHLAKVLTGVAAYDDEIQMLNAKGEEAGYLRTSTYSKSRERTPMNVNNKNIEFDQGFEQLRTSKIKTTSSKKSAFDDYADSPYNPESSDGSDKRSYHPASGASTFKTNSNIASYHPTPMGSKRKEEREYRREDSNKRVYFDDQNDESMDNDQYIAYQQQQQPQRSISNMRPRELEEDVSMSMSMKSGTRSGKPIETPKGTQYASFSVSFGRTESAERSSSPTTREAGSILDAPMKKRVDHVVQTYDVVKGEDMGKVAIRDNWSPQYKVTAEPCSNNRLRKAPQRTQTPTPSSSKSTMSKNRL